MVRRSWYGPLHPHKGNYQREAIARSYAKQNWHEAEPVELAEFLRRANEFFATPLGEDAPSDVYFNTRRREVSVSTPNRLYRVVLRAGCEPWAADCKPIVSADVERFEFRSAS